MAMVFRQKLGEGRRYQTGNVSPEVQGRELREALARRDYLRSTINRAVDQDREVESIFDREVSHDLAIRN